MTALTTRAPVVPRRAIVAAAARILARRSVCVLEVCDVESDGWEPRALLLRADPEWIAQRVAEWIHETPDQPVRLAARNRRDLRPEHGVLALVCNGS